METQAQTIQKPKHILMIASQPFFEKRGSPIRLFFNLTALSELKHNVTFFCLPFGEPKSIPGVTIIRAWHLLFWIKSVRIGPSPVKLCYDIILFFQTFLHILKHKVDVVHTIEDTGPIGTILKLCFNIEHIHEKHSDINSYASKGLKKIILNAYQFIEIGVIKKADQVIGTGTALADFIRLHKGQTDRVHNIHDMPTSLKEANIDKAKKLNQAWTDNQNKTVLLYVGSFAEYQGLDVLLESMKFIDQNVELVLVIIGGTAEEISNKKQVLQSMRFSKNVKVLFLGQIEPNHLPDYLAASDILVSPRTQGNNSPLKILDYLKAGKTLLVSNHTAHNQILTHNEAYFYDTFDSTSLAKAIKTLNKNKSLGHNLAAKARLLFEKKFTFEMFKKRLGICYSYLNGLLPFSLMHSNELYDEAIKLTTIL